MRCHATSAGRPSRGRQDRNRQLQCSRVAKPRNSRKPRASLMRRRSRGESHVSVYARVLKPRNYLI
eukprot:4378858-Alexandrium_andersonii.AAC.1